MLVNPKWVGVCHGYIVTRGDLETIDGHWQWSADGVGTHLLMHVL